MGTVSMEEISYELILNCNQAGLHVVPESIWIMENEGSLPIAWKSLNGIENMCN